MSDYSDIIRIGQAYHDLVQQPGWTILLDDLEVRANQALANLRGAITNDPLVIKGLRDRWVEAEDSLKFVQIRAAEAIDLRNAVIQEVGVLGFDGLDPEDAADVSKIMEFMSKSVKPIKSTNNNRPR